MTIIFKIFTISKEYTDCSMQQMISRVIHLQSHISFTSPVCFRIALILLIEMHISVNSKKVLRRNGGK